MNFDELLNIKRKLKKIYGNVCFETMYCGGNCYIIVHFSCEFGKFRFFLNKNELKKPYALELESEKNDVFKVIEKLTKERSNKK